mmetsp:Transcript_37035/g.101924  ORF Transcript_37035/g.101924 Transcript_37035/m.101924 type:complete len:309 (-) Transcript_37035:19-945(-)
MFAIRRLHAPRTEAPQHVATTCSRQADVHGREREDTGWQQWQRRPRRRSFEHHVGPPEVPLRRVSAPRTTIAALVLRRHDFRKGFLIEDIIEVETVPRLARIAKAFAGAIWAEVVWCGREVRISPLSLETLAPHLGTRLATWRLASRLVVPRLVPSAVGNLVLHVGAILAFFGGAVSFVHIVKASEPVVSSVLNYLLVGEVGLRSRDGVELRRDRPRRLFEEDDGNEHRHQHGPACDAKDPSNTFSVLTIIGAIMLLPMCLIAERPSAVARAFFAAVDGGGATFLFYMPASGFSYYMYNELAFLALGR